MSIGVNLKRLRAKSGMTQGELSEKSGVRVAHISKLERDDDTDPKLSTIMKIASALESSPSELVDGPAGDTLGDHLVNLALAASRSFSGDDVYQLALLINKLLIANDIRLKDEDRNYTEYLGVLHDREARAASDAHSQDYQERYGELLEKHGGDHDAVKSALANTRQRA